MFIIAIVWMGSVASLFGGIFGGITGGGSSYDTRSIVSYSGTDVDIYPTYYYDEFSVYSSEVQTSTQPDVYFDINVYDTGSDSVTVTIHVAIYEIDKTTFDSISTWSGLNPYLVDQGNYTSSTLDFFDLNNIADTYVWVIWFEASSKTDTWSVDIGLTLRYNWNL